MTRGKTFAVLTDDDGMALTLMKGDQVRCSKTIYEEYKVLNIRGH